MKSFPSSLNMGGSTLRMSSKETAITNFKDLSLDNIFGSIKNAYDSGRNQARINSVASNGFDVDGIKYDTEQDKTELVKFDEHTFSSGSNQIINKNISLQKLGDAPSNNGVFFENAFKFPSSILNYINYYKFPFESTVSQPIPGIDKNGKDIEISMNTIGSPSLFNPYYAVKADGITENTPLLMGDFTNTLNAYFDINNKDGNENNILGVSLNKPRDVNCTIKALVEDSKTPNSILGYAKYNYADFMYCKDLGKISNNHLITLRRFAHPVSDNIFRPARTKLGSEPSPFEGTPDIGRLVTWFGTEDNKIENILSYSCNATWAHKESKWEDVQSQEDDPGRGPLGKLINMTSSSYNKMHVAGFTGGQNYWRNLIPSFSIGKTGIKVPETAGEGQYHNHKVLQRYDQNKVYEPMNTIQETHIYEGKLKFEHEIELTFKYQLRSYDNINPKSAFLDLLGNILQVTYRRGTFWGGGRWWIGPPQNKSAWNTTNALIDGFSGKVSDGLEYLLTTDPSQLLSDFGDFLNKGWEMVKTGISTLGDATGLNKVGGSNVLNNPLGEAVTWVKKKFGIEVEDEEVEDEEVEEIKDEDKENMKEEINEYIKKGQEFITSRTTLASLTNSIMGQIKNSLGRPSIYALNTILTGAPVGLWHLTIGNPKNPIVAFGNLIMTNATITHSGPLGMDDFPTEITVKVKLKHARPRDSTEIQRMYTKGIGSIYLPLVNKSLSQYFKSSKALKNVEKDLRNENNTKTTPNYPVPINEITDSNGIYNPYFGDDNVKKIKANFIG